ncbi:hypothetical protein DFQ28_005774 [Apophysomyces sp. BC1034]|nr:hypothetical protein DFQ30_009821 [Apophysomyces sp. BC1015]KAG0179156.1 hypothetical protein DFQ29_002468 [Apophysomyces sp. BC1021]KAG0187845.1 hypothetical protein DFQ28_005774 [Apophysomyces sp. BC1034]
MPPKKSLADQIADLDTTIPKDYDPEDLVETFNDNIHLDSEEESHDEKDAREHYVAVGKSSLRSKQFLLDDPRYSGKQASRKDIYSSDEDEEDVFDDEEDPEISENEENITELNAEDSENEEDDTAMQSQSEDEANYNEENDVKEELRKIEEEEKAMISQMSQSAQGDVEKGQHVRQQLTLWENFLESRIRIQKVVEVSNQLPQHDTWADFLAKEEGIEGDIDAAKEEVREIIDDLMNLRTSLFSENEAVDFENITWNSRKRYLDDEDQYVEKMWEDISQVNDVFVPYRNSTLEKWSNKVQAASGARLTKKFKAFDQNILTQVENMMGDKEKLIRRTQLQRTEYKILGKVEEEDDNEENDEAKTKVDRHLSRYDVEIFDDNDFYQQQLRELIESRMVDTDDPLAIGTRWAASKKTDSKKKKSVDQKASKGRKLRFEVHEKIQNFMAPIPYGAWHDEKTDELYSSLLGQKKTLIDMSL